MIPRVIRAQYLGEYKIHLRFADGTEGDVDLQDELYGEVFEPLNDKSPTAGLQSGRQVS